MDTAPGGKIVKSILAVASSVPGVVEVEKCHARKMGLDYYVDLHVGVDGNISVHEGHEIAHRVKSGDPAKRLAHRRCARAHRAGTTVAASGDRGSARYRSRTIRTSAFDKVFRARAILLAN